MLQISSQNSTNPLQLDDPMYKRPLPPTQLVSLSPLSSFQSAFSNMSRNSTPVYDYPSRAASPYQGEPERPRSPPTPELTGTFMDHITPPMRQIACRRLGPIGQGRPIRWEATAGKSRGSADRQRPPTLRLHSRRSPSHLSKRHQPRWEHQSHRTRDDP
jgi:hypothetical protein